MKNTTKYGFLHAIGTAAYISLVVSVIFYGPKYFNIPEKTILVPIMMLMLFVFSAAVTGSLVFARPIIWYTEGRKKEAFSLLAQTLAYLLAILVTVAIVVLICADKF